MCTLYIYLYGAGGREQLISNGGRFKLTFAKRDTMQRMIDLRGIPTSPGLKTMYVPP